MIEIHNLDKSYGRHRVLNQIALDFNPGQSIALIGPNGSGKTTLIKIILGLVFPDHGSIKIEGQSIIGTSSYRQRVGYMPQNNRLPENLRVKELFTMMKNLSIGHRKARKPDYELYKSFRLETLEAKKLGILSGGMRQQVSAALAFLYDPDIIILDEPTSGLDPRSNEILKAKINKSWKHGKLVVTTSHILNDLDEISTHVVYLMDGKILFYKELSELKLATEEVRLNKVIAKMTTSKESYV